MIDFCFFSERHLEEEFDSNKCTICKITFDNSKLLTRHALKKHGDMIEKLQEQQGNLSKARVLIRVASIVAHHDELLTQ